MGLERVLPSTARINEEKFIAPVNGEERQGIEDMCRSTVTGEIFTHKDFSTFVTGMISLLGGSVEDEDETTARVSNQIIDHKEGKVVRFISYGEESQGIDDSPLDEVVVRGKTSEERLYAHASDEDMLSLMIRINIPPHRDQTYIGSQKLSVGGGTYDVHGEIPLEEGKRFCKGLFDRYERQQGINSNIER